MWGVAIATLLLARYVVGAFVPVVGANLKTVAVIVFLYLPGWVIWRRGEDFRDYGLHFRSWKSDLRHVAVLSIAIFPAFALAFWGFVEAMQYIPEPLASWLGPYHTVSAQGLQLPPEFLYLVVTQLLVVALPEEFFYRGYLYARLEAGKPPGAGTRRLGGVALSHAFWMSSLFFALGHLTEPYPWRLATFFPALMFCWVRARTGSIIGATVLHALSNLVVLVLEASFFPR